ncbi:dinitrogenase iron-molybdenum cofactor N-terminal domain-containing protein [Gynuella sp.]|uniref:dinitrogenase iron-molybdenum cofactor N-terminal domain-containing protein n=1 Tax=Gynuella sp. TaxID=2969146 RepID=UPI003D10EEBE
MSEGAIAHEAALRIALAAREIPECEVATLLKALISLVGEPLTTSKLAKVRVNRLQQASDVFADVDTQYLKKAVRFLKGLDMDLDGKSGLPEVDPYHDGDMPGSIRVAMCSNTGDQIDGHFGSCRYFMIYQISAEESRLIAIRSADQEPEGEDKNEYRAAVIADCQVLYTMSIGGPAAAKVIKTGLFPIKFPKSGAVTEQAERLRVVLAESPPPWLAKIMAQTQSEACVS